MTWPFSPGFLQWTIPNRKLEPVYHELRTISSSICYVTVNWLVYVIFFILLHAYSNAVYKRAMVGFHVPSTWHTEFLYWHEKLPVSWKELEWSYSTLAKAWSFKCLNVFVNMVKIFSFRITQLHIFTSRM